MKFEIFRPYDIRGHWLLDFDEQDVVAICMGFLAYFKSLDRTSRKIVVGRDARPSSKVIYDICVNIAVQQGFEVLGLGLCTTPMVNIAYHFDESCKFRVMITASHNPWTHNGFKLFYKETAVWRNALLEVASFVEKVALDGESVCVSRGGGLIDATYLLEAYQLTLEQAFRALPGQSMSFLVDCMHGAAGFMFRKVIEKVAGLKASFFRDTPYCDLLSSETSALLGPDPSNEANLTATVLELRKQKLSFAMLFDGDADRFVVVLANGKILSGDEILALFAEKFLPEGESFAANVASSVLLELVAARNGQFVQRVPVGVAVLKETMRVDGIALGGEPSAHFLFLKEHFCVDDALFAAYKFLCVCAFPTFMLEVWCQNLPVVYSTPIQKYFFASREKVLDTQAFLAQKFNGMGYRISKIDGIRIFFADHAWILMRASNTENCLSLRIEADTLEMFKEVKKFFMRELVSILSPEPACLEKESLS